MGDKSTFGGNIQAGIHPDGIMLKPTMFLDDKAVIDGAWTI